MPIKNTIKETQQDARLTIRLPRELLDWVQQEGGSRFIREILLERQANGHGTPPLSHPFLTESLLQAKWENLEDERDSLNLQRELLEDEERLVDRHQNALDKERRVLADKRELLEEESDQLVQSQMELEAREEALLEALACLAIFPHWLP